MPAYHASLTCKKIFWIFNLFFISSSYREGEEWLKFRKILNNIILKPQTTDLIQAVDAASDDLIKKWPQEGKILNLEQDLYKWSLEGIMQEETKMFKLWLKKIIL